MSKRRFSMGSPRVGVVQHGDTFRLEVHHLCGRVKVPMCSCANHSTEADARACEKAKAEITARGIR